MTDRERMLKDLARIVAMREAEQAGQITEIPGTAFKLDHECSKCGAPLTGARRQAWNRERLCKECDR